MAQTKTIDFAYARAPRILFPSIEQGVAVIQVGCGGTGSWLAQDIVRILRSLNGPEVYYTICDPDIVEVRNTLRQNFSTAEVGHNKAVAMASRLTYAWGFEVMAAPHAFDHTLLMTRYMPRLVIGCVDNHLARLAIRDAITFQDRPSRVWWLDCGNHAGSGQVLLGNVINKRDMHDSRTNDLKTFPFPGYCAKVFAPNVQHPELLKQQKVRELSCAEITDPQGLTVNRMAAAIAADYVMRLLTGKELKRYATYFDLASGTHTSKYLEPDPAMANA